MEFQNPGKVHNAIAVWIFILPMKHCEQDLSYGGCMNKLNYIAVQRLSFCQCDCGTLALQASYFVLPFLCVL